MVHEQWRLSSYVYKIRKEWYVYCSVSWVCWTLKILSEQVNLGANLVVNKLALKTDPEFVDILVVLHPNDHFMNFIQEIKYKDCLNYITGIEATSDSTTDHLWAEEYSKN